MLPSADENDRQLRDQTSGSGFLYRYRDLVGPRAEWLRQIVVDSQIYFASPADFNDPFDCRIRFRTDGPFDELWENLDKLLRNRGCSREERRQKLRDIGNPSTFVRKVAAGFQREVDVTGVLCQSDAALKCKERFEKNREKLFTFLDYDGVPWNNNNAEHAIKAYAALRNVMRGTSTRVGTEEYLILLSICETCEYQGLDFLDFLRSGEKDIEAFAKRKRRRRAPTRPPLVSSVPGCLSPAESVLGAKHA